MIDGKFYVQLIVAVLVLAGLAYGVHLYKEQNFEQERTEYRNVIVKEHRENNKLVVEKKERKAKDDFVKVEKEIIEISNDTRAYTKQKMEDDNVKVFIDSF